MLKNNHTIFVSDLHIREADDARGQKLDALLTQALEDKHLINFILLGDVFDFFVGSNPYFLKKFKPLLDKINVLGKEKSVYFFEGNHEFGLDWAQQKLPHVHLVQGPLQLKIMDNLFHLEHGDLLAPPKPYLAFRSLTRANPVICAAQFFPPKLFDAFGLKASSESRKKENHDHIPHHAILSDLSRKAGKASKAVFGHFHLPYFERVANLEILSLPSWDRPNFLVYHEDGLWSRGFWKDNQWQVGDAQLTSYFS